MLQMPMIFRDGMVLQRQKAIAIWGKAAPGEEVTVTLTGAASGYGTESSVVTADEQGAWKLSLPAGEAARGLRMTIEAGEKQQVISDISIGEVWIAGGQSNMEYLMRYDADREAELGLEANPDIRFFDYPEISYEEQLTDFPDPEYGFWRQADTEGIPWFSAVGYYFARSLYQKLDVPIGIVGCNWGGTPACAWQEPEGLRGTEGEAWLTDYEKATAELDMEAYWQQVKKNLAREKEMRAQAEKKASTESPDNQMALDWERVMYPGLSWEEQEQVAKLFAAQPIDATMGLLPQNRPGGLYETMLKKVAPFTARGVIWYQGESDENHAEAYRVVFGKMIECWRALWQEKLPFLFVQLAPFGRWLGSTGEQYPTLRSQQERVSREVSDTWMASIGDAGMSEDIHPKHKRPVGERLAELALGHVYEKPELCRVPGLCDAPEPGRVEHSGKEIRIHLRYGEGLHLEKHHYTGIEPEKPFDVTGETSFIQSVSANTPEILSADAIPTLRLYDGAVMASEGEKAALPIEQIRLEGNCLVLSGNFPKQVEICFAWEPYYEVNVYNAAGIPVKPFRIKVEV